jgi:hypothetical protein
MDVSVRRKITQALRGRGVDVLTAQEDNSTSRLDDPFLLDRATALDRLLFTQDEDLLAEAVRQQRRGLEFITGLYAHQLRVTIPVCIEDLELFAKAATPEEQRGRVIFLPLR